VIIGNPPYNANQQNENDNNKNRTYREVDKRIKDTYIARSTAQKTKLYDMYARFFRWASDRLADKGVLTFITNSSFIHSRTFDGFRKSVADEFSDIYLVDLGGDVRANPKLSGTKHNVFGIQTGVAMAFFIKQPKRKNQLAKIHYAGRPALETAAEKLSFLHETRFKNLDFDRIKPDAKGNWLGQTDNDWESLVPLIDAVKESKKSLFSISTLGVNTARDEWVYDLDTNVLRDKMEHFVKLHNESLDAIQCDKKGKVISSSLSPSVKWSESLINRAAKKNLQQLDESLIITALYRPFTKQFYYASKYFSDRLTANQFEVFGHLLTEQNQVLLFTAPSSAKPFMVGISETVTDLHYVGAGAGTQCIPLHTYNKNGDKQPNITAWGLAQFRTHYGAASISGEDIFHYAYAVLHDPAYRAAYAKT
ncbi:MAG: DNA methyltransferase, partial [Cytophagaceae bacterium]